jgi:GNAT superfamily N-acetyltransferase
MGALTAELPKRGRISPLGERASHRGDIVMSESVAHVTAGEPISSSLASSPSRLKGCWFENSDTADSLDFGLATDRNALEQALRLQHDQYVAQGYMDPHPSGWRLNLYNALPTTRVFVARDQDRVVGTMTLIEDSRLGLPMDEIYVDELQDLRSQQRILAEASGLALHPDYQIAGIPILMRLIRMLVLYAAEIGHFSDLCIAINPRHAAFYQKAFHFRAIGGLKQYRKVNGAPAVALRLDLALARTLISELRGGHPVISEVYSFLFGPGHLEPVMARLKADMTQAASQLPGQLVYFFSRHEAWATASPDDRAHLLAYCSALVGALGAPECPKSPMPNESTEARTNSLASGEPVRPAPA